MNTVRMGLRSRLHMGFAVAGVVVTIAFIIGFRLFYEMNRSADILSANTSSLRLVETSIHEHCKALSVLAAESDDPRLAYRRELLAEMSLIIREVRDFSAMLRQAGMDGTSLAPFDAAVAELEKAVNDASGRERDISLSGPGDIRLQKLASVVSAEESKLDSMIDGLVVQVSNRANNHLTHEVRLFFLMLIAVGIVFFAVSLAVGSRLVRRIEKLHDCMLELAGGNYGTPIPVEGSDEFSVMGRTLRTLVDEIKKRESSLRESEELHRLLGDAAFEGIVITERGKFVNANHQFAGMLGYELSELTDKMVTDFVCPDDRELVRRNIETSVETPYEARQVCKDGSVITVEVRARHMEYRGRKVRVTAVRDVTERKQMEDALRSSEQQLSDMFEKHRAIMFTLDPETLRFRSANQAAADFYGYSRKELLTLRLPDINTLPEREIFDLIQKGEIFTNESNVFKHRLANGEFRDVEVRTSVITTHSSGRVCFSIVNDITERKKTEAALHIMNRAIATSISGFAIVDLEGRLTFVNGSCLRMWGYATEQEVLGRNATSFWQSEEQAAEVIRSAMQGSWMGEMVAVRKDGTKFNAMLASSLVTDNSGMPLCIMTSFLDITDKIKVEQSLRHSEERIRTLMETIPLAVYECDTSGKITITNDMHSVITGYAKEEILSMSIWDFQPDGPTKESLPSYLAYLIAEQPAPAPYFSKGVTKDGRLIDVRVNWEYKRDASGMITGFVCALSDITESKTAQERLTSFFDIAPAGIAILAADGTAQYLNQRFIEMFGNTDDGMPDIDAWWPIAYPDPAYREAQKRAWFAVVEQSLASGEPIRGFQGLVRCKDGRSRWIETYASFGESGLFLVLVDITARKQVEEALQMAKEDADAANRAKSEFLANMSHEIRTPLTAIIGFTELILQSQDVPAQKEYLGIIMASAETLLNVVNDVLDLAKIESGKLELETLDFDLGDIINQSTVSQSFLARKKGLEFKITVDPATPSLLRGDPEHLRQILANLVSNAVKFTEKGEITVTVAPAARSGATDAHSVERGRTTILFTVRDTGIGIPPEKQAVIFESFTQADGSTSRKYGGTGLGTTIAKSLVDMMGGTISLDSTPGAGTIFRVAIDFELQDDKAQRMLEPQPVPAIYAALRETVESKKYLHILLTEDNNVTQRLLTDMLQLHGHVVTTADNGKEAVNLWQKGTFDLVLMDMQMPGMNGLEATGEIRRREISRGGHTPIIAITANVLKEDREKCLAAGMDDYLSKPVDVDGLLARLHHAGSFIPDHEGGSDNVYCKEAHAGILAHFHVDAMPGILRRDRKRLEEYVRLLFLDLDREISRVEAAVREGSRAELQKAGHAIKGAVSHLRDDRLKTLAADLERRGAVGLLDGAAEKLVELKAAYHSLAVLIQP